ncbi:MAG: HEAT repeat domain-containing protein [Oscillatoriaceae bacterium SKW80]|nr:HEAT repeat domain-containing protein [Oscillatoriaceae bacterium SKYG93]MCX8120009.1 HEAT repeat domain-containing protein [Oscillatoriaceae bacterium SKW80]MDW8454018.1 HEAT repeat domain-containing protein [Oscillatoriaceae cyanobacterium SKYGB_i_bin93]
MSALTGIDSATAIGQSLISIIPDLEARGLLERFKRVLSEGVVETLAPGFHNYLIPCRPSFPSKYFEYMQQRVTISPLREGEQIAGVTVTIEDVTARREQEQDLAKDIHNPNETIRLRAVQNLAKQSQEIDSDEENISALLQALGDESWRVRRVAVDELALAANKTITAKLLRSLRTEHRNISVLNSALQVLALSNVDVVEPLIEFLNDPDVELRIYAALALGERLDPRAIPALIKALEDVDINVRYHVIEALGNLQAAEAAEKLLSIAQTRDFFLAFPALEALRRIGEPTVAPGLVPLLEDELLCEPAALTLGVLGDEEIVAPLVELLNTPSAPAKAIAYALAAFYDRYETVYREGSHIADLVRHAITQQGISNLLNALPLANTEELRSLVLVLSWLEGPQIEQTLVQLLDNQIVRKIAVQALINYGERSIPLLIQKLSAENIETQIAAAEALGEIGSKLAIPALTQMLQNEEALVAIAATEALAKIGDKSVFEALIQQLSHPHVAVRQAAIAALDSLAHPEMPSRIIELLNDANPYVRESAVKIAGYFAFEECVNLLIECCRDRDERVRRIALEQIPYLDDNRVLSILASALESQTPLERATAARAFAQIDKALAYPYLKKALTDSDPWVRYYAVRSLARHANPEAFQDLIQLLNTEPATQVQVAAVEALGKIGGEKAIATLTSLLETSQNQDLISSALTTLATINHPNALPPILNQLHSPDSKRRIETLWALSKRSEEAAIEAIQWVAATDQDAKVVQTAIEALSLLSNKKAIAALIELTAEPKLTTACILALAKTQQTASNIPITIEEQIQWIGCGLHHPNTRVRCAIVDVLTRLKHPRASELLISALDDTNASVRLQSIRALGYLGNRYAEPKIRMLERTDPDPAVRRAAQKVLQYNRFS